MFSILSSSCLTPNNVLVMKVHTISGVLICFMILVENAQNEMLKQTFSNTLAACWMKELINVDKERVFIAFTHLRKGMPVKREM